jgi:hypothetical protein
MVRLYFARCLRIVDVIFQPGAAATELTYLYTGQLACLTVPVDKPAAASELNIFPLRAGFSQAASEPE